MNSSLRIAFAGTPEFAKHHLAALIDATPHTIVAVYTQPDRPSGRGQKLAPSPVKQLALKHSIAVHQPSSLRDKKEQQDFNDLNIDLFIVVAYGLILPQAILDSTTYGCINSHASLLPRWRGAAPIQRAIEAGDEFSGVTIMRMEAGLDTGPMLLKRSTPIEPTDTGGVLHDRLAKIGSEALVDAVRQIAVQNNQAEAQNHQLANYAHKLQKSEAQLDWKLPANELERKIRAFNPWPSTTAALNNQTFKVHAARVSHLLGQAGEVLEVTRNGVTIACGENSLCLTHIQFPGGKALSFAEVINSRKHFFQIGSHLRQLGD